MWQVQQCIGCGQAILNTPINIEGQPYCQACGAIRYAAIRPPSAGFSLPQNPIPEYPLNSQPVQPYGGNQFMGNGTQNYGGQPPASQVWTCVQCRYEYNLQDSAECMKCRYQNPNPRPGAGVRTMPQFANVAKESDTWTCDKCGAGFNLKEDFACASCGAPKPGSRNSASTQFWKCTVCGFAKNTADSCTHCTVNKPGSIPSRPDPSGTWFCTECSCQNIMKNLFCNTCGAQKQSLIQVQLSVLGKKWKCHCGALTSLTTSQCQSCHFINPFIDVLKSAFGVR